ncbi:receptor protein [[Pseudomonas] boreopolis]|uniref:Receptor protein n=2 Tax=Xanthomonas boreopolis TaxID=86183 RepID=A0A919F6F1_9XANT|nr:receptor protein [[Pseudomonas] boreopolis]
MLSAQLMGPALLAAWPVGALHAQQAGIAFDIPAGPLDQALVSFGRQAGIGVSADATLTVGLRTDGLRGTHAPSAGLSILLAGTGLGARFEGGAAILQRSPQAGVRTTGPLRVEGGGERAAGAERDARGYDDVYDLDISTSYIGRTEVERYKGATPSDLVNGVAGVFSGDARNSGALDINIRGIQGPGRVPVTIDGTEQALTVWRGYNGATNRNYIDPFLIGGIRIIKGPSLARDVATGTGGAMVVNTLDVEDILDEGQRFGGEVRIEGSSNATSPRLPTLPTGEDYRTVEGFPQGTPSIPYSDRTLRATPRTGGGGYDVFSGEDHAYRVALGWRPTADLDLLAAYAYRERGNYYSGKHDAGYYSHARSSYAEDYILSMANYWKPGEEVTNTSSRMESWLFKATWRPRHDQALQFGYRDSLSHYGEIMPSRIMSSDDRDAIQWPLSRVDAKAYNLEYTWKPEGSRWIDLYANVWRTDTTSDTYSAGGFPNYASFDDPAIRNTALANATNTRNGITLSNRIALADTLDLTLGGSFQHEKLRSGDEYFGVSDGWRMYPRAGRREEWQANFNFEWRPLDFLALSAGARYSSYWAFDDFLKAHEGEIRQSVTTGYNAEYSTTETYTQQEREAMVGDSLDVYKMLLELGAIPQDLYDQLAEALLSSVPTQYTVRHSVPWQPDADGNYDKAGNACLNGSLDGVGNIANGLCSAVAVNTVQAATATKRKDHGWVPFFSATINFGDYSRAYVRYGETLRYPSMFESTLAFSASINPWGLKPEHARNWEVAYIHDLGHLLGGGTTADVKLAYYVNKTRDVIERDARFKFDNIDKQTIRGLELQGRYDNGRFFTDLGVNYSLENEVCDESTAAILTTGNNGYVLGSGMMVPNCVDYGFVGGYLLTQAAPELSANWSLGGRFLDRRLELGGRVTYFKQYENADLEWYRENSIQSGNGLFVYNFNVPFSWGKTVVLDAYASYRLREGLSVELAGTNLTDQYYVDPATRSAVAAPGRTLKLSLTGRF